MGLFGTDGVRGKAGEAITALNAMRLAMAAGIYFQKSTKTGKIIVGKDTRRSGYMMENAIVSGLTAVGFDVVQIGPMPTPAVAFLTPNMRCDAGIMISASHNPFEDNGVKFFDAEGNKLNRDCEAQIEAIYQDDKAIADAQQTGKRIGKSKRIDDVIGRYIVHIKNSFPCDLTLSGLRVVIDCANGAGYKVGPTVLQELGAEVFVIGDEPNGFNINDDCGAIHPSTLAKQVVEKRADLGIALDGDADRVLLIDEHGEIVNGDKLMGVLALHLHRHGILRGGGMVATVMSNTALDDFLKKEGLKVLRSAVGDKHVVAMMQANDMNFGGEESGHIIFSDYAKTGDGITSALQALAYLVESGKKASDAFNPFVLYPQEKRNLVVEEKIPFEKIEGYEALVARIEEAGLRHLFRYSGTEKKLRLLIEGVDRKKIASMMAEAESFFKRALG